MDHVLAGMDTHSYNDLHIGTHAAGSEVHSMDRPCERTMKPSDYLKVCLPVLMLWPIFEVYLILMTFRELVLFQFSGDYLLL